MFLTNTADLKRVKTKQSLISEESKSLFEGDHPYENSTLKCVGHNDTSRGWNDEYPSDLRVKYVSRLQFSADF